jgi:hypothetical protein
MFKQGLDKVGKACLNITTHKKFGTQSQSVVFRQLFDKDTSTYTYLLGDASTREAIIIDPVIEYVERDIKLVKELDLNLKYASKNSFYS